MNLHQQKTRHQPEASLFGVWHLQHLKILQGQEPMCQVCHSLGTTAAVFPHFFPCRRTSSSQLLPSTAGVCDTAVGMGRAATLLSSVETWWAGTIFLKSNHLPISHPWIATQQLRNTKLPLEQLLQTTSLSQLTKPNFSSTFSSQNAEFFLKMALAAY